MIDKELHCFRPDFCASYAFPRRKYIIFISMIPGVGARCARPFDKAADLFSRTGFESALKAITYAGLRDEKPGAIRIGFDFLPQLAHQNP